MDCDILPPDGWGFTAELWGEIPRAAQIIIATMARKLEVEIADLKVRVSTLEAKLQTNSTNSSKPPSSDPPGLQRTKKLPSNFKRGGQPGHPGNFRMMSESPDAVVDHIPQSCTACGNAFDSLAHDLTDEPIRYQVTELPEPKAIINE